MTTRCGRVARRLAVAFVVTVSCLANGVFAGPVPGQGTWESTLQARDINGDRVVDAYYDTALNVTWLADWNANNRQLDYYDAKAWAEGLNVYGVTGWRLPSITDNGCIWSNSGTDCGYYSNTNSSEPAHMYYITLGGGGNTGPFSNLQTTDAYWAVSQSRDGWYFYFGIGQQWFGGPNGTLWAVAVRPGDVAVVPEPETYAMLLAGLGLLGFMARRRRQNAVA